MKSVYVRSLIALTAFALGLFAAGCADKGNSPGQAYTAGKSPTGSPNGGGSNAGGPNFGTSDSGGGTGVAGKVFESYIVDPLQLPEFKQYVEPLLNNIKPEKENEGPSYAMFFKMKTWYIAPVEFDKIGKDALGISFVQSATEQIARQSLREVWINKTLRDQMDVRKQAELQLHELVMTMYFYKFLPITEMCKTLIIISNGKSKDGCEGSADDIALLEKMMPAEKLRPLNDEDNENIRFVTGWMLQNLTKPVPEVEFVRILYNKGFDRRMFNPDNYTADPVKSGELSITADEFFDAVNGAKLSGQMPHLCTGVSSGKTKDCLIEIATTEITLQNFKLPGFRLKFSAEGEKPVDVTFNVGEKNPLSTFSDGERGQVYSLAALDTSPKVKLGDRLYSAFVIFRKEAGHAQSGLILDYIILKPGVVTSIDKKREPNPCLVRAPKVVHFFDDVVIIKRDEVKSGMAESMITALPPLVYCSTVNVD